MPQQTAHETLAPGTILDNGRYQILEVIGTGGYASVYKALDLQYGYERAIKEVITTDEGIARQFRLEADVLINIQSPNVPRGYNVFTTRGRIYFAMDFVQGKDLEELLNDSLVQRRRALDEAQTLQWMIEIAGALHQLHTMPTPIIHRDIKPANIKITLENRPVLIDFGLAKLQEQSKQTQTAAQGVSPGFAPPEQYMAKGKTDARTDVYGLGATLYACLTGKDPAEAPARLLEETGVSHGTKLERPSKLNSHISRRTEEVILRALELAPGRRQQTALQLRDELRAALVALQGTAQGSTHVMPPGLAPHPAPQGKFDQSSGQRVAVQANGANGAQRQAAKPPARAAAPQVAAPPGMMAGVVEANTAQRPAVGGPFGPPAPAPAKPAPAKSAQAKPVPATTKQPMVSVAETSKRTLASAAQEAAARSSGQHPVVQPLVAANGSQRPVLEAKDTNGRMLVAAGAVAEREARAGAAARPAGKKGAQAKTATAESVAAAEPAVDRRAMISFGKIPVSAFGKWMLALAGLETIWGLAALSLGLIALTRYDSLSSSALLKLGGGWVVVTLLVALIGGQALSRPVYRRGNLNGLRRLLQGTALFLFAVLVHAVALFGMTIFLGAHGDATPEVIAYTIFGFNVLLAGVLSVVTILD